MFTRKTVEITRGDTGESLASKFRRAAQSLCLLLILVCKLGGDNAVEFVERNLRLQRFCRLHLNFTAQECDSMDHDNFTYVKNTTETREEDFVIVTNWISVPISLLVISLAASWSDRHGRKCLIKVSIVGYFLAALCYALFTIIESLPVEVLLAATILRSMVGGPSLFLMAVFSMTIDKTDFEARPIRLGRVVNFLIVGRGTGYITGLIYQAEPFWTLFVALLYYILAMFVATKFLKEEAAEFEGRVSPRSLNSCLDFLHPKNASDLFLVAFKKRPGRRRVHLLLIFFVTFFLLFSPPSLLAEWETTYLGWDSPHVTIVSAAFIVCGQIFTIVVLKVTEKSPIPDCLLAAASEGMTALQDLLLTAVIRPDLSGIVYGAMVFSIWHNLGDVGIRLALTKIGGEDEIGRIFGIMALQETAMTWAKGVAFRSFWDATRDYLPTSQHVLSASFALLNSTVLLGVFFSERSKGREKGTEPIDGNTKTTDREGVRSKSTEAIEGAVKSAQGCDNMSFEKDCRF